MWVSACGWGGLWLVLRACPRAVLLTLSGMCVFVCACVEVVEGVCWGVCIQCDVVGGGVARNYIFSLIWRCYGPKRYILDYWGTNIVCMLSYYILSKDKGI